MRWYNKEIEIRYADTDRMGVIHHGVYPLYCEVGRTWYCEAVGIPYAQMEQSGIYLMVADMQCRFKAPATYGDSIYIKTAISTLKKRVVVFVYEIWNRNTQTLLFTGSSKLVVANNHYSVVSMPLWIYEKLAEGMKI